MRELVASYLILWSCIPARCQFARSAFSIDLQFEFFDADVQSFCGSFSQASF